MPPPRFLRFPGWRRLAVVAAAAFVVVRYVVTPSVVLGESMEPAYSRRGLNAIARWRFWFREPRRGEVVVLRWRGRAALLKRVLAFAGETVEFRDGVCYVDGAPLDEPWVVLRGRWNLPPRTVAPGRIYVMGDNRSMDADAHVGGEIARSRLLGGPLL